MKVMIPLEQFESGFIAVHEYHGDIDYWAYISSNHEMPYFIVGFAKTLTVGTLFWTYSGDHLQLFGLNDKGRSSLVEFALLHPEKVALTIIQEGETLVSYNGDRA